MRGKHTPDDWYYATRNSFAILIIAFFWRRCTYTPTLTICSDFGTRGRPRLRGFRKMASAPSTKTKPRSLTGIIPRRTYIPTHHIGLPMRRANLDFDSIIFSSLVIPAQAGI